jgi:hypothetical protein
MTAESVMKSQKGAMCIPEEEEEEEEEEENGTIPLGFL